MQVKKSDAFYELIKQYKELALTVRDSGKGRRAVTMWENGEEDLSEASEEEIACIN